MTNQKAESTNRLTIGDESTGAFVWKGEIRFEIHEHTRSREREIR